MGNGENVTRLLHAMAGGDKEAMGKLMPVIYDELQRIAQYQLRGERNNHTLNTTALVHEAYLKLVQIDRIQWQNRAHFMAIAARSMRNILSNYARRRNAQKRGGKQERLSLTQVVVAEEQRCEDLEALDEALNQLEKMNERQARVVECRFFAGMNIEETAEALNISPATVKRDWNIARAWLNRELKT